MPPSENTEVVQEQKYQLAQNLINKSLAVATQGLETVKPYTPTRVATLAGEYSTLAAKAAEPYVPRAQEFVESLDDRLDSSVIKPTIAVAQGASARADDIVTKASTMQKDTLQGLDTMRTQMGFVGTSITESCGAGEEGEGSSLVQLASDKASSLKTFMSNKYYKVLENADHGIEIYFAETGGDVLAEKKAETPVALITKAARRFKPSAAKLASQSKMRTQEQLEQMVHVDLISYAADVIDKTAATTYDLGVKRPLALKKQTYEATMEAKEKTLVVVEEKKKAIKGKATEVRAEVTKKVVAVTEGVKVAALEKAQPAIDLAKHYNEEVAKAYTLALEKATDKCDTVILVVKSTKKYVSDKVVLVFNDGIKALVMELRTEGFLPVEGKATIANAYAVARLAPAAIRARADVLAAQLSEQIKQAPPMAKAKLTELYTMVLVQKDSAVTQAPILYAQAVEFASKQAAMLVELAKTAPELAQQKMEELYAWFLTLTPQAKEKLETAIESCKALPGAAKELALATPAKFEANFPTAVTKAKEAMAFYETQVSPAVMAQWTALLSKVEEAKSSLELETRLAELKDYYTKVITKLNYEENKAAFSAALSKITFENLSIAAEAKYTEAVALLTKYAKSLKAQENWDALKAKIQELKLKETAEAKWFLVKDKLQEYELLETVETLPTKALELSAETRAKLLAFWKLYFGLLLEKVQGFQGVYTETVKEESSPIKDPFDDKFDAYCKENGLDGEEDEDVAIGEEDENVATEEDGADFKEYYAAMTPEKADAEFEETEIFSDED